MPKLKSVILILLIVILCGCSTISTNMQINKDKSMNITYLITLDKDYLGNKTFNELLEAINNKYNIQIYFSSYNSYCKVSTYVKDNSIIELSFILDKAFSKITYIKSTNNITITQYSISDVTTSISNDNINAISSGAVYNLKTDLESKISSIKSYVDGLVGDINNVLESIING